LPLAGRVVSSAAPIDRFKTISARSRRRPQPWCTDRSTLQGVVEWRDWRETAQRDSLIVRIQKLFLILKYSP
jgi:hypothetical protein